MHISVDELKNHRFFEEWLKDEFTADELKEHESFDDWIEEELEKHESFEKWLKHKSCPKALIDLKTLADNCDSEPFAPKETLRFVKKSNDRPCFYLIKEGAFIIYFPTPLAVKVDYEREFGEDRYFFAFRSKIHETIGEIELTEQFPQMRARCMFDEAQTIAVPIKEFQIFLEKYPKIWQKLFSIQMRKLESARRYTEAIQLKSGMTGACVAAALLAIANDLEEDANKNDVVIKLLLKDFQAYISEATPGSVRKKLNALRDNEKAIKYVESGRGVLAIEIDREKLKTITLKRSTTPKTDDE